jgi:hypothetical protein
MSKKYNNKSNLVQLWTTAQLKRTVKSLHCSIYQAECFSAHDLRDYDACVQELQSRGYRITSAETLEIFKK